MIHPWPVARPDNWLCIVNETENSKDLQDVRYPVNRGLPLGDPKWVAETAKVMGIESHLRKPGRPPKARAPEKPSRPLFLTVPVRGSDPN